MYIAEAKFTFEGRVFQINEVVPNDIVQDNVEVLQHTRLVGDKTSQLLTDAPSEVDVQIIQE